MSAFGTMVKVGSTLVVYRQYKVCRRLSSDIVYRMATNDGHHPHYNVDILWSENQHTKDESYEND